MDVSDENFLDGLMDGLVEGVTPLTQDDATPEDNHHPDGEKLLVDDLELGADQDLMESQQQEEHQQQEQHQEHQEEEQHQEQQIFNINQDVQ